MERVKVEFEFVLRTSPSVLYQFFTTPDRLILWFCDAANVQDDVYTFEWEGSEEEATLIDDIEAERVRFSWVEEEPDEYFEFKIKRSPVTRETILLITDYCDKGEEEDTRTLWDNQISDLKRATGEGV